MPDYRFTTLQFYVPRRVGDLIDTDRIAEKAHAAGVPKSRFEYSTYRTPPTKALITCNIFLAPIIIEGFAELAKSSKDLAVVTAASEAVMAGLAALEKAGPSKPGDGGGTL